MAYETPTNPRAAKVEAEDLRREAQTLLTRADQLDPPEAEQIEQPAPEPAEEVEPEETEQEPEVPSAPEVPSEEDVAQATEETDEEANSPLTGEQSETED